MEILITDEGVWMDKVFVPFGVSAYDDFVYILQRYGLRNLVENVSKFTITNESLINELMMEFLY